METPRRSLVKALCWNGLGLAMMSLVGVIMTGSIALGGVMAAINTGTGFVLYLVYERIWARVAWGRQHD